MQRTIHEVLKEQMRVLGGLKRALRGPRSRQGATEVDLEAIKAALIGEWGPPMGQIQSLKAFQSDLEVLFSYLRVQTFLK